MDLLASIDWPPSKLFYSKTFEYYTAQNIGTSSSEIFLTSKVPKALLVFFT